MSDVYENFQEFTIGFCGEEPPHNMHQPNKNLRWVCRGFAPEHEAELLARPAKIDDLTDLKKRIRNAINNWQDCDCIDVTKCSHNKK